MTLRLDLSSSSLPEEVRARLIRRFGEVVEVVAGDTRSQWRNREIARERLGERLAKALVEPKPRKKTKPSRRAREQRLDEKRARSRLKRSRRRPDLD